MPALLLIIFLALQIPADRVIGLLELPDVLGVEPCVPYATKPIELFAAASVNSERTGTIEVVTPMQLQSDGGCTVPAVRVKRPDNSVGELPTEEILYEIPAAIVHERSGNWFRIRLDRGSGWMQSDQPEDFTPYANLVISFERPPYLEEIWDGRLFSDADQRSMPVALPEEWRSLLGKTISFVNVLESQTKGGELWFRIRLGTENACGELPESLPRIEGWIPAYAAERRVIWFYSRGC